MGMVDEALAVLADMAESLGLEEDERESFIDSAMKRKGFKQVSSWAEPEPDEGGGGGGGDFFSRKKAEKSQTRQVGGGNRSGAGNWQYGG